MAESVIGLYKTECVAHDGPFRTVDDLELATLSWVHWFNTNRLHSALNYATPIEAEEAYYRQINPRQQPLPGEPALHETRFTQRRRASSASSLWTMLRGVIC